MPVCVPGLAGQLGSAEVGNDVNFLLKHHSQKIRIATSELFDFLDNISASSCDKHWLWRFCAAKEEVSFDEGMKSMV